MFEHGSYVIGQSSLSDEIVDDFVSGSTAWTSWSIGLVTAALGFMLLALLAKTVYNRL